MRQILIPEKIVMDFSWEKMVAIIAQAYGCSFFNNLKKFLWPETAWQVLHFISIVRVQHKDLVFKHSLNEDYGMQIFGSLRSMGKRRELHRCQTGRTLQPG